MPAAHRRPDIRSASLSAISAGGSDGWSRTLDGGHLVDHGSLRLAASAAARYCLKLAGAAVGLHGSHGSALTSQPIQLVGLTGRTRRACRGRPRGARPPSRPTHRCTVVHRGDRLHLGHRHGHRFLLVWLLGQNVVGVHLHDLVDQPQPLVPPGIVGQLLGGQPRDQIRSTPRTKGASGGDRRCYAGPEGFTNGP